MLKLLSYPLTIVFYIVFGLLLCIFHPIQWICLNVFGYQAHKKSVDYLNFFLLRTAHILGTRFKIEGRENLPTGVPVILVANHQSLYDIVMIIWFLRKAHPKFVSKKELGKGIPSVSYNLNHGGSVLIDRKDPKQALPTIKKMGEYIEKHRRATTIFPEGTRTKNGVPKTFQPNGLKMLCKYAPSAVVVPITINNSWKMFPKGYFPLGIGNCVSLKVHSPMPVKDYPFEVLMQEVENTIIKDINYKN